MSFRMLASGPAALALAAGVASHPAGAQGVDDAHVKKTSVIHERVIALDAHDDISPSKFVFSLNYTQELDTLVNLPTIKSGSLDVLRVMDEVQKIGRKLQKGRRPNDESGRIAAAVNRSPGILAAQPARQPKRVRGTFWLALGLALVALVVMLA